ncbi:MAG: hypothetical protein ACRD0K_16505 [Egibacteraceae bacterium]
MTIGAGACGGDPHDSEIVATIEGVWRAAGIDPGDAYLRSYQRHTRENTRACEHLPTDDRWFADRLGLLPSNIAPQDQIYDGALAYLEREGFTVERYEARHPEVDRPALRAVRADLAVLVTVAEDGNTALDVSAGPCAVQLSTFSEEMYQRVD